MVCRFYFERKLAQYMVFVVTAIFVVFWFTRKVWFKLIRSRCL